MKLLLLPTLLLLLAAPAFGESAPGAKASDAAPAPGLTPQALTAGAALRQDLEAIAQFSPRAEGSKAEADLVAWIKARLSAQGVRFTSFDFSQSDFQHSFSTCIRVDLPGTLKDTLVLAVPIDSPLDAEPGKDGSVNVALALDFISRARSRMPPVSLTVLFLGAEFGEGAAYPMGSTLFLRDYRPDYKAAVVYLNLRALPARVLVRGAGRGIVTPYWLMNRCVDALRQAQVPFRLQGDETQIFRMGTTDERTMIEPYLRAGYPSVGLEGQYGESTELHDDAWLASFSGFLQEVLTQSAAGIPEEWDRHYLLLQAGDFSLIVSEKIYVSVLLGTLALALLYSLTFRRGLKKYLRTLTRNFPALIPLAGLTFAFLAAGTFAVKGVLALRGFDALWTYAPLEFLGLKIAIALFLYTALYNIFRRLPFPRNGSFYSAAALLFLLVDIMVIAVFNISFTYYFLWAFLFVFLSALVPNRYAKAILFLPAPFWGLRGVIIVFTAPALPFCHFLLLSPVWGNLLAAGVCLPFILILLRLGLIFPGKGVLRRRVRELILACMLLLAGVALGARLATFSPFSPSHPQPMTATQTISVSQSGETASTTLSISSPAPLGALAVQDVEGSLAVDPSGTAISVALPLAPSPVQVVEESSAFLQQMNVTLHIDMPSSPRLLAVTLASENDFILFDCSFPFVRENPREYRLLIGAFPPDPLPLQLSLPADGTFTVTITMDFDAPLIGVQVQPRSDAHVVTRIKVVRSVEVKT